MPKKKKESSLQKVTLWEGDDDVYANGTITFTPEFLEELLAAYDDGDEEVVDAYDDSLIKVRISLRESEYDNVFLYGTVYKSVPKEGGRSKSRGRAARSRSRE